MTSSVRFTLVSVTLHGLNTINNEQDKQIGDTKYNILCSHNILY